MSIHTSTHRYVYSGTPIHHLMCTGAHTLIKPVLSALIGATTKEALGHHRRTTGPGIWHYS